MPQGVDSAPRCLLCRWEGQEDTGRRFGRGDAGEERGHVSVPLGEHQP